MKADLIVAKLFELNKTTIATQAKKFKELITKSVVYVKAIKMMGDNIFNLGIENEALRDELGKVDEKGLDESRNRIKLSCDDQRNKKFILERMKL